MIIDLNIQVLNLSEYNEFDDVDGANVHSINTVVDIISLLEEMSDAFKIVILDASENNINNFKLHSSYYKAIGLSYRLSEVICNHIYVYIINLYTIYKQTVYTVHIYIYSIYVYAYVTYKVIHISIYTCMINSYSI
jgi:hypothetical protein